MTQLEVSVGRLRLPHPIMTASGILDETGASMRRLADAGAAAVVTKSIGLEPRPGHGNPTMVDLPDGRINAMGLPGPGIELFEEEMEDALKGNVPIVGSLFASKPDDFSALAGRMEDYGAAAVELNLSCPHAIGYGMEIGIDPDMVRSVVSAVKQAVGIPVWAKITPNTHRLAEVGRAVEDAGGDAIVAINTVKAMAISVEMRRPVLSNGFGGLSGQAIKPIGLRCVYELYVAVEIPIVGVGGISTGRDALEYVLAGASALQVGTAIGDRGLGLFESMKREMLELLDGASVTDLRGAAHEL